MEQSVAPWQPPIFRIVPKVFAYVVQHGRLLTLLCPGDIYGGVQVPAGTIETGESPLEAVLRETREETGLDDLRVTAFLGRRQRDMQDYGLAELHDRYFFRLAVDRPSPETWEHVDLAARGGPKRFLLRWRPLAGLGAELVAGHDALLPALSEVRPAFAAGRSGLAQPLRAGLPATRCSSR